MAKEREERGGGGGGVGEAIAPPGVGDVLHVYGLGNVPGEPLPGTVCFVADPAHCNLVVHSDRTRTGVENGLALFNVPIFGALSDAERVRVRAEMLRAGGMPWAERRK